MTAADLLKITVKSRGEAYAAVGDETYFASQRLDRKVVVLKSAVKLNLKAFDVFFADCSRDYAFDISFDILVRNLSVVFGALENGRLLKDRFLLREGAVLSENFDIVYRRTSSAVILNKYSDISGDFSAL